ncbi:MAG: hypothetical protein ABI844_17895, partial [Saprospiraceae bacterium]
NKIPKIYFYTTACMWALYYLKETKFDVLGLFKGLLKITKIKNNNTRNKLSHQSMNYLQKVEARLWY